MSKNRHSRPGGEKLLLGSVPATRRTTGMSGENSEDMLEENRAGYQAVRAQLEVLHMGRTALLHQGKVAAIYNDTGDA